MVTVLENVGSNPLCLLEHLLLDNVGVGMFLPQPSMTLRINGERNFESYFLE